MDLPATFGKYELLERIGTGGMAEVFLARSFGVAGFEKRLVIKRIRPDIAEDPRFINMFINEAKIGVHLNHPNIVQLYDLGRVGHSWYIAMEHLNGRDLNKVVKRLRGEQKKVPLATAVAVVAEACRGLSYAHNRMDKDAQSLGLVHRDVSPHNLLITFAGEVKLVDFGIARLMNTAQAQVDRLAPGRPGGGKYAYMSPQQAQGLPVDHRTDIYSAGIVLWELIVGHRLYQHPDPSEKLRCVIEAVVPHPNTLGTDIDDLLWDILKKALAKQPEDRYSSASLMEEDLRAWLFHNGVSQVRDSIASVAKRAFPEQATASSEVIDLKRMVADMDRLDPSERTTTLPTPARSVADSISDLPGRLRPAVGERKTVAVLIVDVDGLTDLSMRLEPELLFKRHYQMLRWIRRTVDRYGGLVQRAIDDQIMVLFGVPKTLKTDLARSLECALEMRRTVDTLMAKGLRLELAIGVHVGDVTIGVGKKHLRYLARGDTTRLARRLSSIADHGEILVSPRVIAHSELDFTFDGGPEVVNRGERPNTPSYRLTGRRRGLRVAGKAPWVRRGNELETFRSNLVKLAANTGSIISLIGDVGSGKSRLVRELRDLATKRTVRVYKGQCAPYGENPPMAPFRDLINDVLNIETELTDEVLSARLEYLHQLSLSEAEIESLANLLRRTSTPNQPGAEFIWHALERVFAGLSADSPTIIVLEDIHHLAKYELNRLAAMMHRSIEAHPLMFILTRRDVDDFPSLDFGVQVTLGSFGLEEQRRLIANLLEVETISDEIMDLVARTCEGNPLYLEEMIKYLLKEKQIRCADGAATLQTTGNRSLLPDSLASLLAARIDALDKASKGVLQLCSTIGHTFSTLLLREAMGIDDVIPLVTRLSQHGLIQQSSGESSEQWSFTSELVRAAAQRGILGIQRREYHLLIANAIESLYSENLDSWAEALANHYAEGGRLVDAARFAHRAAVRFEEQQFLDRARVLFQRGLKWINRVPRDPDNWDAKVQGEATFNYRLGALAVLLGDHTTAERYLQVALDISGDCGLSWIEARAHLKIGRICMQNGKLMLAEAHVDQARSLAQISRDPEMIMEALEAAANLAYDRGENQSSEALWTEALALASDDEAAQARCLLGMSNCHIRGGTYQDAEVLLDKALSMARSTGDRILIGRVLNNMGLLHFWGDQHTDALEAFREALRVRQGIGYTAGVVINHHNIGDVYFSTQDWARAWVAFERSRELAKEMGWTRGMILNDVYLGYIDARRGSWSEGLNRITMATKDALDMGDGEIATNGLFLAGRLYLENNMLEQARTELTEAKAQAERFGIRAMQEHVNTLLRQVRDQQASTQSEEE